MEIKINSNYLDKEDDLIQTILKYDSLGEVLFDGNRNQIKIAQLKNFTVAIKSFKVPNPFNMFIYRHFRKPKAQRSFEYAKRLMQNNIGTAEPLAYGINYNSFGLSTSYYVSKFLEADILLGDLIEDSSHPDREVILRQFTRFTYSLHELGIEFLDHSPGNTLIREISPGRYKFYLIDLNRMRFHNNLPLKKRLQNFDRLSNAKDIIQIISSEYAKLIGEDEIYIHEQIMGYSMKQINKRKARQLLKRVIGLKDG